QTLALLLLARLRQRPALQVERQRFLAVQLPGFAILSRGQLPLLALRQVIAVAQPRGRGGERRHGGLEVFFGAILHTRVQIDLANGQDPSGGGGVGMENFGRAYQVVERLALDSAFHESVESFHGLSWRLVPWRLGRWHLAAAQELPPLHRRVASTRKRLCQR